MSKPLILVIGSLNADLVQPVPRLPLAGETLSGGELKIFAGGKGANQACAASRLGALTRMAGQVGSDAFSGKVLSELELSGVDISLVSHCSALTGTATILVLPNGENCILLSPGANGDVSAAFAAEAASSLKPGDFLLCQLEIPIAAVEAAFTVAKDRKVTVILDPAPAIKLPRDLLNKVSILTPNQTEAAILLGNKEPLRSLNDGLTAAIELQNLGPATVIVKMGELGCAVADGSHTFQHIAQKVNAIDSTAAGDTFNGALAAALLESKPMPEAIRFASTAASISVTRHGAIASMPFREEVDKAVSGLSR